MKILLIQTAFIGDVVLATPLIEKLHAHFPGAQIDFLVRKGNESLLTNHPYLHKIWVLDKKKNKYRNIYKLIREIREVQYDYVINAQRFFASGLITALSGGKQTIGFDKNPLSFLFSKKIHHYISAKDKDHHEVHRNLSLIRDITNDEFVKPKLYPAEADFAKIQTQQPYICIAPSSVWFTKQYPKERWIEFMKQIPAKYTVYLLGAKADFDLCSEILKALKSPFVLNEVEVSGDLGASRIQNLAGQLSYLESAALMSKAVMNYVNDSAPLHFASAMNAPVTAIFCSTVPAFGFGPLSDVSFIAETDIPLTCRPCGLHGYAKCPLGHFKCSVIEAGELLKSIGN